MNTTPVGLERYSILPRIFWLTSNVFVLFSYISGFFSYYSLWYKDAWIMDDSAWFIFLVLFTIVMNMMSRCGHFISGKMMGVEWKNVRQQEKKWQF